MGFELLSETISKYVVVPEIIMAFIIDFLFS